MNYFTAKENDGFVMEPKYSPRPQVFYQSFLANVLVMFGFREQHDGDLYPLSEPTVLRNID